MAETRCRRQPALIFRFWPLYVLLVFISAWAISANFPPLRNLWAFPCTSGYRLETYWLRNFMRLLHITGSKHSNHVLLFTNQWSSSFCTCKFVLFKSLSMRCFSCSPGNNKMMMATTKPTKARHEATRFNQRRDKKKTMIGFRNNYFRWTKKQ